jgi:hypothetical protein
MYEGPRVPAIVSATTATWMSAGKREVDREARLEAAGDAHAMSPMPSITPETATSAVRSNSRLGTQSPITTTSATTCGAAMSVHHPDERRP